MKLVLIVAMCMLLSACKNTEIQEISNSSSNTSTVHTLTFNLDSMVSPKDKRITELTTTSYSKEILESIANFQGTGEELNTIYPMECVRKREDGCYNIYYQGNDHIAVILIDKAGEHIYGKVYTTPFAKDDYYSNIRLGQTLEDVMNMDADDGGNYLFLHTGVELPRVSTHYTRDGYIVSIVYDDTNMITDMYFTII